MTRLKSGLALGPVVSAGMWQAAQPMAMNIRSPSRSLSPMAARPTGARNFMNASKLSMPASPGAGLAHVLGFGPRIAAADLLRR